VRFFLDTANVDEIRQALELGMCDGVTTNPSLLAREGKDYRYAIREISRTCSGPVSAEVLSEDLAGMTREGKELARIAENVVVKLPMTKDGLLACARLVNENIRVNVTLVFSAAQALLAARAGATYVSPFVGRLDDIGSVGMDLVRDIVTIYDNYEMPTQILVASVRNPNHVIEAALTGADVVTIPFSVLDALYRHPLTDAGLARFRADWETAAEKLPVKKVIRGEKGN
jgi:transaldolase